MSEQRSLSLTTLLFASGVLLSACGGGGEGDSSFGVGDIPGAVGTYYAWMNAEIESAWSQGFFGQLTRVLVLDDFSSSTLISGNLGPGLLEQRHGEWVKQQITYIAPQATVDGVDFNLDARVRLVDGLNILNLSYGMYGNQGIVSVPWGRQESSVIEYAQLGSAVVVKSAGNDGNSVGIGEVNRVGEVDYLARDLIGAQSAIFVGALSSNGSITEPAAIESYSNVAGKNELVQSQFLVVGVEGGETDLYGTSFAAPVVSGYAAILGSKFTSATPTQIVNQLLNTAQQNTVRGYSPEIHGRGEASIAHALAPQSIN